MLMRLSTSVLIKFICVVTLFLTSCGFQLRGEVTLPTSLKNIQLIIVNDRNIFARQLRQALQNAGAHISTTAESATSIMNVERNDLLIETLTVDNRARVSEYIIRHIVTIEIATTNHEILLPKKSFELTRTLSFDETQALGIANEQALIEKELQEEMVQVILQQLAHLPTAP